MGVCAERVDTKDLYCTFKMTEDSSYTYNLGYILELPVGEYYIFSYLVTDDNREIGYTDEKRAYYSDYVVCGMTVKCKSHKPVKIEILEDLIIDKIDPIDWYK